MTKAQKIIKYLAIAFAIFLIFQILAGAVWGLKVLSGIYGSTHSDLLEENKIYDAEGEITALDIDVAAVELVIREGANFAVETNSKQITYKEKGGRMVIEEKGHNWWRANELGSVYVYVKGDTVLRDVKVNTGAGKVTLKDFSADRLEMDLGAGTAKVARVNVSKETDIDGGAGKLTIKDSVLCNLDLDMGVGELIMQAQLPGNSEIDCGVGNAKLTLAGSEDDYCIEVDKGLGSITIAGEEVRDETAYGYGTNLIHVDGGVGNISVLFGAKQGEEKGEKGETTFLSGTSWAHYDPASGEGNVMSFHEDGTYSYHCECGEPVGDSDLYENYTYDENTKKIALHGVDSSIRDTEMTILESGKGRLLLAQDGNVLEFLPYDDTYCSPDIYYEYADYMEGYSSYEMLVAKKGDAVTTGPANYDGDVEEQKKLLREMKLAKDVRYEELDVKVVVKGEEEERSHEHRTLTAKQAKQMIDSGSGIGFVWYNESLEIQKILFYGELIVQK